LNPEPVSFTERGISYVYGDLRNLPFRDGIYDTIICISTLEHVGMDNSRYGAEPTVRSDPASALHDAVAELKRVLAHGGALLVTVPYGQPEDYGWFRQFDATAVEELVSHMSPKQHTVDVYGYSRNGWQASSLERAAEEQYHHLADPPEYGTDLAAAARAVACIRATF
jgi:ubiquinone/menaquinone biosynthesis C-methylase UbiE